MEPRPVTINTWHAPWTRHTLPWIVLAFLAMSVLEYPFVIFFDTVLTHLGFTYVYFWALPQALILYLLAFKLRLRWNATVLVGLLGVIGAPIDYYFEWVVQQNLLSPLYALLYIPLYALAGLTADVSLRWLHPEARPRRAAWLSACIFTAAVLATTSVATFLFYPAPQTLQDTWLGNGVFLVPYALLTGGIGGYLGFSLAGDLKGGG